MIKILFCREHLPTLFGLSTAWTGFFLSYVKTMTTAFQLAAAILGAGAGLVTLLWTIWKWKRDAFKFQSWKKDH